MDKTFETVTNFDEDIFICNTYILPTSSPLFNQNEFDFFEQLESDIAVYKNSGKIFLAGDLNGRTSSLSDSLDYNPYLSIGNDSDDLIPRANSDHVTDSHGRAHLIIFY